MNKKELVIRISQELSGQWTIPILLKLEDSGGRFTPLKNQLKIVPARLSDNLNRMIESGWIKQLTPYERRHPLLPEYVLTEKGSLYHQAAIMVQQAENEIGAGRLSAKAWNIPVMLALEFGYERFQEIRHVLQQVTPRMLSMRLDELSGNGFIIKHITEQPKPSFLYQLSEQAKKPVYNLSVGLSSIV